MADGSSTAFPLWDSETLPVFLLFWLLAGNPAGTDHWDYCTCTALWVKYNLILEMRTKYQGAKSGEQGRRWVMNVLVWIKKTVYHELCTSVQWDPPQSSLFPVRIEALVLVDKFMFIWLVARDTTLITSYDSQNIDLICFIQQPMFGVCTKSNR